MRWGRLLAVAATLTTAFADAPAAAPPRPSGKEDLARALRTGHYEEARRLARARLSRAPDDAPVIVMAARAEMALGRYEEARARLERAASAHPDDLPLRDTLMRLYETVGDTAAAAPLVEASYGDWNAGKVDRTHPADLLAIATAVRLDGNWKDANDVLRDAVRADRRRHRGQPRLGIGVAGEAQRRRRRGLLPRRPEGRRRPARRPRRARACGGGSRLRRGRCPR